MKRKRILAFLLTLALVLGALPLAAFAAYTAPTAEEIQAATQDEENAGLIYANGINGVTVTPTTTGGNNSASTVAFDPAETTTSYYSYTTLYDQGSPKGCYNVYASQDGESLIWKSHPANMNNGDDNNNCLDIGLAKQPAAKSIVLAFEYTMYAEAFAGEDVVFRVINTNSSFSSYNFVLIQRDTGNLVPTINGKVASDIILADPAVGETVAVAIHVKVLDPAEEGGNGSVVFDVYINGELKGSNLVMYSEKTLAGKSLYAKDYTPKYFRLGNMPGEVVPYGLSCDKEDHSACGEECPYGKDLFSLDSVKIYYSDTCYESVHGTAPHTMSAFGRIDEAYHGTVCSVCGASSDVGAHDLSAEGYCSVCEAGITGTSLAIDSNFNIKYYVSANDSFIEGKSFYMNIAGTVIDTYQEKDGQYIFTYEGVGPHQIGDKITAALYVGDNTVASKTYSVEQYCLETLELHADDEYLVQFIHDILIYARAAETYRRGSTDIADGITLNASEYLPTEADDMLSAEGNEAQTIYAAGVKFDSVNSLFFKIFDDPSAYTVDVDGTLYEDYEIEYADDGYKIVYSSPIAPLNFDKAITVVVNVDGWETTVTYSVNTYAYYMQGDEQVGELATALYRYGKSCEAYFAANTKTDIVYNLNGGTNPLDAPASYDVYGGTVLPTPTNGDLLFCGWYKSEDLTDGKISVVPEGTTGTLTLYAKWSSTILNENFNDCEMAETTLSAETNICGTGVKVTAPSTVSIAEDDAGDKYMKVTTDSAQKDILTVKYDFDANVTKQISVQFDVIAPTGSATFGFVDLYFYMKEGNDFGLTTGKKTSFHLNNIKSVSASSDGERTTYRFVLEFTDKVIGKYIAEDGTEISSELAYAGDKKDYTNIQEFFNNVDKIALRFQIGSKTAIKTCGVDNIILAEGDIF